MPPKVPLLLLEPTVKLGVPLLLRMVPEPVMLPASRLKPAIFKVPVTVSTLVVAVAATKVTVCPVLMKTGLVPSGTSPPNQMAGLFQLPEPMLLLFWACMLKWTVKKANSKTKKRCDLPPKNKKDKKVRSARGPFEKPPLCRGGTGVK